ncbi:hypothetical protein TCAL_05003 [Tigriopus californicus]|uniref:tRNA pseudouridine(55) synthase n=2 Tax=Tigriopus californicus TaxID=6832 RepID=A0A553PMM2_TIGCA|nr:hypothetical protein TCAL_05003 [Tigriopus californicus]
MWTHEIETVEAIQGVLNELDCSDICRRCVLRLAGVKKSHEFLKVADPPTPATDQDPTEPESKKAKLAEAPLSIPPCCRACLGIMQDSIMAEALSQIGPQLTDCPFDADHFTLAVSVPTSLALREHSLKLILTDRVPGFFEGCVVPVKQAWKWINGPKFEAVMGKKFVTGDSCQFFVEFQVTLAEDEAEKACLVDMCKLEYLQRQHKQKTYHMGLVTRVALEKSLQDVSDEQFRKHYPVPPTRPLSRFQPDVKMTHNSIFLAGRYNKYSRELPQTPWLVDGERKAESSVEELIISDIKEALVFDSTNFSSSGREDVDVRMLGDGRPFLFELTNPRQTMFKPGELYEIQKKINAHSKIVQVHDLQLVKKAETNRLKEGEDQKTKTYNALCRLCPGKNSTNLMSMTDIKAKLELIKNLELKQRTPIRVLHRRPNAVRKRSVYFMEVTPLTSDQFKLRLSTQAGTYVKEFVHGDFDRTIPNLSSILETEVDILALDVENPSEQRNTDGVVPFFSPLMAGTKWNQPISPNNGLASPSLEVEEEDGEVVKATIFGWTKTHSAPVVHGPNGNDDDALHLSKLRLCDNPSETYHVPNIIPSLRKRSLPHPILVGMNERLKQAKGLVYCTLWYLSIMVGYYFLYAPLLPLLIINRKWYRRATDVLYTIWESFNVSLLEIVYGVRFFVSGDAICSNENSLIILNHRTRVDWNFLWGVLLHSSVPQSHNAKLVLKQEVKQIPGVGWTMQMARFLYITRKWQTDEIKMGQMLDHLSAHSSAPFQLVLFPEGTNLTKETKAKSDQFAIKNQQEPFAYLLHPRTTGFSFLASRLRENQSLNAIYDLTMAYPDEVPEDERSMAQGVMPREVHCHIKRYKPNDLPTTLLGLDKWLQERWNEKEQLLEKLYEQRLSFPAYSSQQTMPQPVLPFQYLTLIAWLVFLYQCVFHWIPSFWGFTWIVLSSALMVVISRFTYGMQEIEIQLEKHGLFGMLYQCWFSLPRKSD